MAKEKLIIPGIGEAEQFMTPAEYEAWSEKFLEQVRPELEHQAEARHLSELAARHHFIHAGPPNQD